MTIRFSRHALRASALLTLLLPASAFLLTWVRLSVALPCVAAVAAAFIGYVRSGGNRAHGLFGETDDAFFLPVSALLLTVACALLWTFLSGIGGYFYQNEDHYGRNAIFHDLLDHSWPVYFDDTPYALNYYVAYWILPALIAKAVAFFLGAGWLWPTANAALFVQTVWFLLIIFLLLLETTQLPCANKHERLTSKAFGGHLYGTLAVCLCLLVFVLFSGMDALLAPFNAEAWRHQIEWWAQCYQYSSHTTCLFWVYNQAVPAWLATMLLLSRPRDVGSFALIGLAALPFSPLPLVGMMIYFAGMALCLFARAARRNGIRRGVRTLVSSCLTARNLFAIAGLAPVFCLYFMANAASGSAPLRFEPYVYAYGLPLALLRYALFALVEFGCLSLAMGSRFARDPMFWLTQLLLLLAPLFKIGYNMDFSMRASIPGLTTLCVYAIRFLLEALPGKGEKRAMPGGSRFSACALALLLLLGSITPLMEFERGIYKVREAGTIFLSADPFGTVLHPDADTDNFICRDVYSAPFYRYVARERPQPPKE